MGPHIRATPAPSPAPAAPVPCIRLVPLLAILLATASGSLHGQDDPPPVEVGGMVQLLYNTTNAPELPPGEALLRRIRVTISARPAPWLEARVVPDLRADRAGLTDAYIRARVHDRHRITIGRAFQPFGRISRASSARMIPPERTASIRGFSILDAEAALRTLGYAGREIGVMADGTVPLGPGAVRYESGLSQAGIASGLQSDPRWAGRLGWQAEVPFEAGVSWSAGGGSTVARLPRRNAWAVDAGYGAFTGGPLLLVELSGGDVDPDLGSSFRGGQLWAAYRGVCIPCGGLDIQPGIRVSHLDTNDDGHGVPGMLLTPVLGVHGPSTSRIMIGYDIWSGGGTTPAPRSLKVVTQVVF